MALTVTRTSGSVGTPETDVAVPVEDGNDILRECAGGCGRKILFFGFPDGEWGEGVEGAYCIGCRTKPLKHVPKGK